MISLPLGEFGFAVLLVLMIAAPTLHWYLPRYRGMVEEMVKDRRLTGSGALQRLRALRVCADITALFGAVLLVLTILDLLGRF